MSRSVPTQAAVLFVCMGNICRSPLAEGLFRHKLQQAGLADAVRVDSAGTEPYHVGHRPDPRAIAVAAQHGVDLQPLRARQFEVADFERFTHILVMDAHNHRSVSRLAADDSQLQRLHWLLDYALDMRAAPVEDPYYGGQQDFETTWRVLDRALDALLHRLAPPQNAAEPSGERQS